MLICQPVQGWNELALGEVPIGAKDDQGAGADAALKASGVPKWIGRRRHTSTIAFWAFYPACYVEHVAYVLAVVKDLFFAVKVSDGAKRAGRSVRTVASVEQALATALVERPAMLVADLNCDGVDMLELARRWKADETLCGVPLLGFVPHVREDRKRAALDAGFDRVVARSTFSDRAAELLAAG